MTYADPGWLTIPELVERMCVRPSKVHKLLKERALLGTVVGDTYKVPAVFLRGAVPVPEIHGTATVLHDAGFTDDEAIRWMLSQEPILGTSPIEALLEGRKAEVRRVAQALA